MTGPEHYLTAEREIEAAEAVMNADYGWIASLSSEERMQRRMAYLACAQVHATLAAAAATAEAFTPFDRKRQIWLEVLR